jgi:hypothetical protein
MDELLGSTNPSPARHGGAALRRSRRLTPEGNAAIRLRRQWVVTRADDALEDDALEHGWARLELGHGLVLRHHPEARIRGGCPGGVGALTIGVAVSTSVGSEGLDEALALLGDAGDEQIDRFLHHLCGTYVLLTAGADGVTLSTDPAGMMTVYRGHGRVASTPTLLGPLERDPDLDREFPFGPDNDWYPGTLTPFKGVDAVPANHALDLRSGRTRRTWPRSAPPAVSAEEGLTRLGGQLRTLAERVLECGPIICSLTGGKDSRINLAALGDRHPAVEFFTVRDGSTKACDVEAPRELARRFGLDHTVIDAAAPPGWLLELYDEMSAGLSIGGRRRITEANGRIAGPDYIHLNGSLGAVLKAYFWPTREPVRLRRSSLSKEFVRTSPRIEGALDAWLGTLPDLPPGAIYNLMYLEQRAGRWAGVGETASNLFYDSVNLLASREVMEAVCGLPARTQYGGRLPYELVEELWPELLSVPYCTVRRTWSAFVPRRVKSRLKRISGHA